MASTSCKREGCTEVNAENYDPKATHNDGSCRYTQTQSGDNIDNPDDDDEDIIVPVQCRVYVSLFNYDGLRYTLYFSDGSSAWVNGYTNYSFNLYAYPNECLTSTIYNPDGTYAGVGPTICPCSYQNYDYIIDYTNVF